MIFNITRKTVLAKKKVLCKDIFSRGTGLTFRSKNSVDDCGWIFVFNKSVKESITMTFVFFPIDLIFLDTKMNVVEIKKNLKPWQLYFPKSYFQYLIELKSGTVANSKTAVGDRIRWD